MKKYLLIIILLFMFIFVGYAYLSQISVDAIPYVLKIIDNPLIYLKKELIIDDIESFDFDEYFQILSNNEFKYKYTFNADNLNIFINNNKYSYPYKIKEKEKEIITEYIIQEVYIENNSNNYNNNNIPNQSNNDTIHSFDLEPDYFYILNDYLSFPLGSELSQIINEIQNNIDTNIRVSIDYSSLNPNSIGEYIIYIHSNNETKSIIINIF